MSYLGRAKGAQVDSQCWECVDGVDRSGAGLLRWVFMEFEWSLDQAAGFIG
jgi:hypothetical protein